MAHHVDAAVGLPDEACHKRLAALVCTGHQADLVDPGADLGLLRINRRLQVAQGAQALNMAFAEQIAAVDNLLDQLVEIDRLPLAAAARADTLHRRQHPERRLHLLEHAIAGLAGRRAAG